MGDLAFGGQPAAARSQGGVAQYNATGEVPPATGGGDTTIIIIAGDDVNIGGVQGGDQYTPGAGTGVPGGQPPTGGVNPSTGMPTGIPSTGGGNEAFLQQLNAMIGQVMAGLQDFIAQIQASAEQSQQQPPAGDTPTGEGQGSGDSGIPVDQPGSSEDPTGVDETDETEETEETEESEETEEEPEVDEEPEMTDQETMVEAVAFLEDNVNDIPSDGDYNERDLERAAIKAEQEGKPEVAAAIRQIKEGRDALSALDGEGGDLNGDEISDIARLLEQGFTMDQLVTEGNRLKDNQGFWDDNRASTLLDHRIGPGFASEDDEEAEKAAVEFLRDNIDTYPSDGSYNADDIRDAAEDVSDPKVKAALLKMADKKDQLSELDGEDGDLNAEELERIASNLDNGFSLDYQIEEGQLLKDDNGSGWNGYDYQDESHLEELGPLAESA